MNRKKSLLASTNGLKIAEYFAERNRSSFDLIKGDTVDSSNAAESGSLISDLANSKTAKVTIISALIGNSALWLVMKRSLYTFMILLLCTILSSILGNIAYYLWNKVHFSKEQARLFEELVLKYYEVEDTFAESLKEPADYKPYARKWGTKKQLTEFISAQVIGRCMQVNTQQPNMVDNISVLSLERMNDILTFSYTIPPADILYNNFILNKGWLYYIWSETDSYGKHNKTGYLYRVKVNGTFNEKIIDEAVLAKPESGDEYSEFYISDDVLHYTNSEGLPRAININSLKADSNSALG